MPDQPSSLFDLTFVDNHGQEVDLAQFEALVQKRGAAFAARPRVAVIAHDLHMQLQQPAVVADPVAFVVETGACLEAG